MSWLSHGLRGVKKGLKKLGKSKVVRGVGKFIDVGADFLPPGLREIGNVGGKLLEGQNLKSAAIGSALDYGAGRLGKVISGKLVGNKIPLGGAAGAGAARPNVGAVIGVGPTGMPIFAPPGMGIGGAVANAAAGAAGGGGWLNTLGGAALSGVKKGLGGFSAGDLIKGAATGYDIYNKEKERAFEQGREKKYDAYNDEDRAAQAAWFASRAPLRQAGEQGLLHPKTFDYSSIFNAPPPVIKPITTPAYANFYPQRRALG